MKEKAKALGLAQLEYDGCSDFCVRSWEDFMNFHQSPEYAKVLGRKLDPAAPVSILVV